MRKNNLYTLSAALMALIAAPSVSAADYISHRSSSGLTAPSAAPAKEDANVILLGHVSPQEDIYPYTGFNNGGSEDLTLEFGVRLTSDMLAPYAGAKITGIRVGWGEGPQPYSPDMTAFLRSDMNGDNITSGTATVNMGWNEIKYDNPQTITGDSDLFIGGVVPYPPQIAWLATGCWGGADLADDIQYMGVQEYRDADGNIEWEHPVSSMEKILILAIVEAAGDDYEDMMSMPTLRLNDVQSLDEEGAARVIIRNDGTNTITDFDVRIECGDMSWTTIVDLPGEGLPSGTTGTLNIPFQALASGVHKRRGSWRYPRLLRLNIPGARSWRDGLAKATIIRLPTQTRFSCLESRTIATMSRWWHTTWTTSSCNTAISMMRCSARTSRCS